ncbi:hypothetical protein PV392_00420 [Streptomyces sp. ME03-5709C]|nr:hypothetical protein [Streptomyces sp. ME03-5709C]
MNADLTPVTSATTRWLLRSYPHCGGVLGAALAEAQARQAVTVAAWLRYPTAMEAALLTMAGPGGSGRLDRLVGAWEPAADEAEEEAWRSWVDEVVASWAACLLGRPDAAADAVARVADREHMAGLAFDFRRLVAPDDRDLRAAALLRHPDLLEPVAALHRDALTERLAQGWSAAA